MPRINETIVIADSTTYKATRPQNGDVPALWREVNTSKTIGQLNTLNLGVTSDKSAQRDVVRVKGSLVFPIQDSLGNVLPANRIDIKARLDQGATTVQLLDVIKTDLIGFIQSDEFAEALLGEAQF